MNQPDVNIDHNNQRTTTVLRIRNNFNRLAEELIQRNRKDSALKVLDRIVELMPQSKYPYDIFTLGTTELYYRINETEKANRLIRDYLKATTEMLRYLFSLEHRFDKAIDYEKQVNIQLLQELGSLADKYGQVDLIKEVELNMQQYMGLYYQNNSKK